MRSFSLLVAACLLAQPLYGMVPPYRRTICGVHLIKTPLAIEMATTKDDAIRRAREFRGVILGELYGIFGTSARVTGSSKHASAAKRKRIAERVRGIELDLRPAATADEAKLPDSQKREQAALVLVGKDEISEYMRDFDALVALASASPDRLLIEGMKGFLMVLYPLVMLVPYLTGNLTVGEKLYAATFVAAMVSYLAIRMGIKLDAPYASRRSAMLDALGSLGKDDWFFRSDTLKVAQGIVDESRNPYTRAQILANPESRNDGIITQNFYAAMDVMAPMQPRFSDSHGNGRTYVLTDEILYRDPQSGEPILVVFLRTSETRPLYPRPATNPEPVPEPGTAPVLIPIPLE